MLFEPYVRFHSFSSVWVTEWPLIGNALRYVFYANQTDVIEAFNSTSRYLDDLPYFEGMVKQIYPTELQLNKANTTDTEAPFLDLHLSIANGNL